MINYHIKAKSNNGPNIAGPWPVLHNDAELFGSRFSLIYSWTELMWSDTRFKQEPSSRRLKLKFSRKITFYRWEKARSPACPWPSPPARPPSPCTSSSPPPPVPSEHKNHMRMLCILLQLSNQLIIHLPPSPCTSSSPPPPIPSEHKNYVRMLCSLLQLSNQLIIPLPPSPCTSSSPPPPVPSEHKNHMRMICILLQLSNQLIIPFTTISLYFLKSSTTRPIWAQKSHAHDL